ncbi:MAG: NUDIX domain-containing protein [Candidatus Sumerlaeaceae bacterium]|nr:NUDIX domain-containing protein [Candidatus Sumerlaeaceae bacterium]
MLEKVQVHVYRQRDDSSEPVFLLLRRTAEKNSIWQPVTGKVERGETLEEAAVRELLEETGLKPKGPPAMVGVVRFLKNEQLVTESVFLCEVEHENVETSAEHAGYEWLPMGLISERLHYKTNRDGFLMACKEVRRRCQTR